MSIETIAILISGATLLLGYFTAFGWMAHRSDQQFVRSSTELGGRIDRVEHELVEVKIAVARIEGPPRPALSAWRR